MAAEKEAVIKKGAVPTDQSDTATQTTGTAKDRPALAVFYHIPGRNGKKFMEWNEAKREIRSRWRELYQPAQKRGQIICPLCGHGTHGDGITENPKADKPGSLKCFSCGFSGDVIDLIQKQTGADFNTAIEAAATELGIRIDRPAWRTGSPQRHEKPLEDKTHAEEQRTPQRATEEATAAADYSAYYEECAARVKDPKAASYLSARGISQATAEAFGVGFDPAWISPTVRRNQEAKGSDWLPEPTARIIVPVTKNHYIARAISAAVKDYAKMNETGNGSAGIFNLEALWSARTVFITEGLFDALAIEEAGAAAIALNSVSMADSLLRELKQRPTRATVVLCLDHDEAGKKAQQSLKEGLDRLNVTCMAADICGEHKDPNEALTKDREKFLSAVSEAQRQASDRPDNISSYIDSFMQADIERMKQAGNIKTGFSNLDKEIGSLYPGLYLLAAPSSLGKTTFLHQISDNLAAAGHDVLFFSLEQSRLELATKSLARTTARTAREKGATFHREPGTFGDRVTMKGAFTSLEIRKGETAPEVLAAIQKYKEQTGDRLSIIEGNFGTTASYIRDYVAKYMERTGTRPIVCIDYLQVIQPEENDRRLSTKEQTDNNITAIKRMSRDLDLTVLAISSINRTNYLAPIDFEALKESGNLEFTADVVLGLQLSCIEEAAGKSKIVEGREMVKKAKAATPREIKLVCLKNRYGISSFECLFNYYPQYDLYEAAADESFTRTTTTKPITAADLKNYKA